MTPYLVLFTIYTEYDMIWEVNVFITEKELGYRSSEFSDKEYSPPGSGKKKKKKGSHCFLAHHS